MSPVLLWNLFLGEPGLSLGRRQPVGALPYFLPTMFSPVLPVQHLLVIGFGGGSPGLGFLGFLFFFWLRHSCCQQHASNWGCWPAPHHPLQKELFFLWLQWSFKSSFIMSLITAGTPTGGAGIQLPVAAADPQVGSSSTSGQQSGTRNVTGVGVMGCQLTCPSFTAGGSPPQINKFKKFSASNPPGSSEVSKWAMRAVGGADLSFFFFFFPGA